MKKKEQRIKEACLIFRWRKLFYRWEFVKQYSNSCMFIDPATKDWDRWCVVKAHRKNWIIYIDECKFLPNTTRSEWTKN